MLLNSQIDEEWKMTTEFRNLELDKNGLVECHRWKKMIGEKLETASTDSKFCCKR